MLHFYLALSIIYKVGKSDSLSQSSIKRTPNHCSQKHSLLRSLEGMFITAMSIRIALQFVILFPHPSFIREALVNVYTCLSFHCLGSALVDSKPAQVYSFTRFLLLLCSPYGHCLRYSLLLAQKPVLM